MSFLVRVSLRLPPSVKRSRDGEKVKWPAFLSPLDKIVSMQFTGKITHLLMWTCESFYCHTKLPSWSTWPLETHVQLDKKVVFFLKVVIWFRIWEVVNTGIEVEMSCSSSAVTTNQIHVLFYPPGLTSCCNWQVVSKKGLLTVLYFALCGLWDYLRKKRIYTLV